MDSRTVSGRMLLWRSSACIAPLVIGFLFYSTLAGEDRLAFRDVSHFYTPLYDYVDRRTEAFLLPLWNPDDYTGIPLLGESTTAVLYPVRALVYYFFDLPEQAIAWYVCIHLLICFYGASWLARRSGVSHAASSLAGFTYTLSGSVFFLYTNPPFLVGAAWLPLAIGATLCGHSMRLRSRIIVLALALCMMVLGGDPQTGYHVAIIAVAVLLLRCWRFRSDRNFNWRVDLSCLAGGCLIAGLTAAPQIAASVSWGSQSQRIQASEDDRGKWFAPPDAGGHRHQAYQFSLPPWHLVELGTPNAWGHLLPENRRLSQAIPGDGRMWTPTIYVGMFGAMALIASILSWRREGIDLWSGLSIAALLLSMGHFGLVWLVQQIPGAFANTDSAVGGLYWWLYQFAPGYSSFRYPAKWLPFFSIGTAVLASCWADRLMLGGQSDERNRFKLACQVAALVATTGLVLTLIGPWLVDRFAINWNRGTDEYWGTIDFVAGFRDVRWSCIHSLVVVGLLAGAVFIKKRRENSSPSALLATLMAGIIVAEMTYVGGTMITKVNMQHERELLKMAVAGVSDDRRFRVQVDGGWPKIWKEEHSSRRIEDAAAAERGSGFARWHLVQGANNFNSMISIQGHQHVAFWQAARAFESDLDEGERAVFWDRLRGWLNVNTLVVIGDDDRVLKDNVVPTVEFRSQTQTIQNTIDHAIHSRWHELQNEIASSKDRRAEFTRLFQQLMASDDRSTADPKITQKASGRSGLQSFIDPLVSESIHIVNRGNRDQLLVRCVLQDGHWIATATNTQGNQVDLPVHQVDQIKQGVVVAPGDWIIQFDYSPWWLMPSLALMCFGCSVWMVMVVRQVQASFETAKVADSIDSRAVPDPIDVA